MEDEVLNSLIEMHNEVKEDCVEQKMFYNNLKNKLKVEMNGENGVLEQYKMSCTSFLESKLLELNFSAAALIFSSGSLFFSIFKPKKLDCILCILCILFVIAFLIGSVIYWTIYTHKKEKKVREILYVINDIESEKNNQ